MCSTTCSNRWRSTVLMPGGATTERQFSTSRSMPCSRNVGAFTPGTRSELEMASTRTLPASMCGASSPSPLTPTVTCPPRMADSDSPPPEYAM